MIPARGVVLDACQNSMRLRKVTTEDLFPFASQVDSGVAELIRKQEAGWSYIRAGEGLLKCRVHEDRGTFPLKRIARIISGEEQLSSGHGTREMPVWGPFFSRVDID